MDFDLGFFAEASGRSKLYPWWDEPGFEQQRTRFDNTGDHHVMTPTDDWQEGGCHCGAVRFRVKIRKRHAVACNCSMCAKKGMVNVIVPPEDFELIRGESDLKTYRFNTGTAEHRFCGQCGIHPFSRPRSHPGAYDVNGRCLDDGVEGWEIDLFDGQNWEANVAKLRD